MIHLEELTKGKGAKLLLGPVSRPAVELLFSYRRPIALLLRPEGGHAKGNVFRELEFRSATTEGHHRRFAGELGAITVPADHLLSLIIEALYGWSHKQQTERAQAFLRGEREI